jgi:NAD(P)-dependent dehydrogenase (short-subunit alcohol dehydrogenase family)
MIERGNGSIVVTANTAAWRGQAHFAGFAPTKAAQRVLAESMARRKPSFSSFSLVGFLIPL